jgi:pilus assembly protein CpaC
MFLLAIAGGSIVYADDSVRLMVGRSAVVNLGAPIARVSLTSSDVADALVTSPSELLINGKTPGTISMFVWDRAGAIRKYEIVVQRDLARLSEQIKQLFPNESIDVQSSGRDIVLSGAVSNKDVIDRVASLAGGYVDKKDEIVSLLRLQENAPSNQVLLRVRFAEVSRSAITSLGVGFFTSATGVKNTLGRITTDQVSAPTFTNVTTTKGSSDFGAPVTSAQGQFNFGDFLNLFFFSEKYDLGAMIRALQTRGLFQSLAEPNLVAESGKEASFLAGGEFPIPIAQGGTNGLAITVQFKEFGVRLNFTPTVIGNRIHLKVKPEVSTLDFTNAVILQGFRIPALTTRRTETELELADGQTFAIAGLLNNTMTQTLQKIPGIGDIPILGDLFKSKAAEKDRTELVVMITPQILSNNSYGVTRELPRLADPFLPQLEQKKSLEPAPPPFVGGRGTSATSAAIPQGLSAAAPMVSPQMLPGATPVIEPADTQAPVVAVPPMTDKEKKALDRARKQEAQRQQVAQAADAKAAAKQAGEDQRRLKSENQKAGELRKQQEKALQEQARRDAEQAKHAAKQQVENDKKQLEEDQKQHKAAADAEVKLKAAQAAYDAEAAKNKKPQ